MDKKFRANSERDLNAYTAAMITLYLSCIGIPICCRASRLIHQILPASSLQSKRFDTQKVHSRRDGLCSPVNIDKTPLNREMAIELPLSMRDTIVDPRNTLGLLRRMHPIIRIAKATPIYIYR